jgi:hypothetical protein
MAGGPPPSRHQRTYNIRPGGASPRRRRSPSRGFLFGIGVLIAFALFLAVVGVLGAQRPPDGSSAGPVPLPAESPIPVEVTVVPPEVTPDPDYASSLR